MTRPLSVIAFDGDDTLWHNESLFTVTQERFRALLRAYLPVEELNARLIAVEERNLAYFGYGIKGFVLSMIETAIQVSEGAVPAPVIQTIIDLGKEMVAHPVELLEGVRPAIEALPKRYRLLLITKGDLFDQESKVARSGLGDLFWRVEIVAEKDERTYRRLLTAHGIDPGEFLMVGNSIKSDILPVVAAGGRAVHVPYHTTWALEHAELGPETAGRVWALNALGELSDLLPCIEQRND